MTEENSAGVSTTLRSAYAEQYTDQITEWRELGGKYKAENIVAVCKGHPFTRVLDCGAGEGAILKHLDAANVFPELHAIEISDSGIAQIEKRRLASLKEVKKFDGDHIPYTDKYFSMAFCSHVIEHVEHPRMLLRELKRVSEFQVLEVPLDYSRQVDRQVEHFLSYGHINIYTPSLFKFLIKSEGYEILAERLSHTPAEVERYSWYHNLKLKKTFLRELTLRLRPALRLRSRLLRGKSWYEEYAFSAYTCLAKGTGELKIF
jgi:ubiquinone/menaquinone biosynthesis C-methylase UbiE